MRLYVVPTPIGNLEDITLRALRILKEVDCIFCEDTRTSSVLLKHYQINTPVRSYHQHNEHALTPQIINELQAGKTFALISDAGTPGISDAGYLLIRACILSEIPVETLPGATALIPAVVTSGLPCNQFLYLGFLPLKKGRHTLFTQLATSAYTIVFYESPHRVAKTLKELLKYFPADKPICVCRELSKKFETYKRGTLEEIAAYYEANIIKGEVVIVL